MAPPRLSMEQTNCGPYLEPPAGVKTPFGQYRLASIMSPRDPDAVAVLSVPAGGENLPRGLAEFKCPRILLLGDTHHQAQPLQRAIEYAKAEPWDAVVVMYDRHHIPVLQAAGVKNVRWFPGLTFPFTDQEVKAARQDSRGTFLAFLGQALQFHPRRSRYLKALDAAGVPVAHLTNVDQRQVPAFYGSHRVGLNMPLNGDFNLRTFEIVASGAALLTERLPGGSGQDILFKEGEDYLGYTGIDELVAQASRLVREPDLAARLGKRGASWFDQYLNMPARQKMFKDLVDGYVPEMFQIPTSRTFVHFPLAMYEDVQQALIGEERLKLLVDSSYEPEVATYMLDHPRVSPGLGGYLLGSTELTKTIDPDDEDAVWREPQYNETQAALAAARCQTRAGDWQRACATYSLISGANDDVRSEMALVYANGGAFHEAERQHRKVLSHNPKNWVSRFGLAQTKQQLCLIDEAIADYGQLITESPNFIEAISFRAVALNYRSDDPALLKREHLRYGQLAGVPVRKLAKKSRAKIRVGMLSPDFRQQSCAYFLTPLIEGRPDNVELFLYHDSNHRDAITARFAEFGKIAYTVGLSNEELETLMVKDDLDVAVDLAGHFGKNRLSVFARRVAPVQISHLGYPNTSGVAAMDYRIGDKMADAGYDDLFTEKLIFPGESAWTYRPYPADWTSIPKRPAFGYFGMLSKITDEVLATWAKLIKLTRVDLIVKGSALEDPETHAFWKKKFTDAGVPPKHLKLVCRTKGMDEHLQMYGQITVALDSWPYNGTTTTCEAFWMGVPTVSLCGNRHASRVGMSLVSGISRPELAKQGTDNYVVKAAHLIDEPVRITRDEFMRANWVATQESVAQFWGGVLYR
jgi:tetratricopeptide (TPR) repeat protein